MNFSGIKRGLAVSAISALAVAGLPQLAGTASAESVTQDVTATVGVDSTELFTQFSGVASVQNDGANTTVHLLAGGGTNVAQVRFEYQIGAAAPVTIATVGKAAGVFSTEWAPGLALLGQTVTVRAVPINASGNVTGGTADSETVNVNANAAAVNIDYAPGAPVGVFRQPYATEGETAAPAIVTGTTSATTGGVQLSDRSEGSPLADPAAISATDTNGVRTFRGVVNFEDYILDVQAPGGPAVVNEAVIGAQPTAVGSSDDAEVVNLRAQAISGVTATPVAATVPNGQDGAVVVAVTDQFGNQPIAGAQVVYDANNDGILNGADEVAYTDASGQATFDDLTVPANSTATFAFYVNTTDGDDFEPAIDFRRTATISGFNQTPSGLTTVSNDGAAFDVDENAADDLQARVVDQNGAGVEGATVSYTYTFTPFATTAVPNPTPTTTPVATAPGTTNPQGVVNIPFQDLGSGSYVLNTFVERDGTPGQSAGDLSATPLNFKAGDADLDFVQDSPASQQAGTTRTYDAVLALEDNTPLPGRVVNFTYAPGGNSQLAAQAEQPAGTTRTATGATDTSDGSGTVSVAVVDPATPNTAETGTLTAATGNTTSTNGVGVDGNANTSSALTINFGIGAAPAGSVVTITEDPAPTRTNPDPTPGAPALIADLRPGITRSGSVTVVDVDTDGAGPDVGTGPIAGATVTLTVDKGFFTNGEPTPAPAAGSDVGNLTNLGQTITVTTGPTGEADFELGIGRSAGFDDDGLDTQIVTATSGGTDTEDYAYDSSDPLNGGEVELELAPTEDQEGPTDPADINQDVAYTVITTDQFGNRVGDEEVEVTSNNPRVDVFVLGGGNTVTTDFDDVADVFVSANSAQRATITATWDAPFTEYAALGAIVSGTRDLTDTAQIEFETAVLDEVRIVSSPEGDVPVGTVVTETITALDQNDQPIAGAQVEIFRTGPGSQTERLFRVTDANGQAVFSFTSNEAGTANITATVTDGGNTVQATDTVVFTDGGPGPGPDPKDRIRVNVTGGQAQDGRIDILRVRITGGDAAGATATVFRANGPGQPATRLQAKVIGANNRTEFRVRDLNGNALTNYFIRVTETDTTLPGRSPNKKFR